MDILSTLYFAHAGHEHAEQATQSAQVITTTQQHNYAGLLVLTIGLMLLFIGIVLLSGTRSSKRRR